MLKISISGARGTVPDSLTSDVCLELAKAFGTYLNGGTVVVGCDTRQSSEFIKGIAIEGLMACGCKAIDLSIATTPTVGVLVKHLKAKGGLIITASHNPEPWNGLKFVRSDGIFLNEAQAKKLLDIYYEKKFVGKPGGSAKKFLRADSIHINKILEAIDCNQIKASKFKVVIDSCNGAGSIITPLLLKKLGCHVIEINTRPKAPFPRGPEPTPQNIAGLAERVKKEHADIGFAQDPDADRLAVVSDCGEAISEEYTLALCANNILSKKGLKKKLVVANLSTSLSLEDVANKFGAKLIRTKIGEVHVAEKIKALHAPIGGEGNGGVIFPKVGFNRDSLSGIVLILDLLAQTKKCLSKLIREIPKYYIVKDKIECADPDEAFQLMQKIKRKFSRERLDLTEGIKVLRKGSWLHIRPSNTEPIIRIFSEAKGQKTAEAFIREAQAVLRGQ